MDGVGKGTATDAGTSSSDKTATSADRAPEDADGGVHESEAEARLRVIRKHQQQWTLVDHCIERGRFWLEAPVNVALGTSHAHLSENEQLVKSRKRADQQSGRHVAIADRYFATASKLTKALAVLQKAERRVWDIDYRTINAKAPETQDPTLDERLRAMRRAYDEACRTSQNDTGE